MFENKYSNFLTVLLVIIIIAIIGCIAFGGYKVYQQINSTKEANDFVNEFIENATSNVTTNIVVDQGGDKEDEVTENITENTTDNTTGNSVQLQNTPQGSGSSSTTVKEKTYKGFSVIGTIEIPKIKLSYPILKEASTSAIEKSVAMLYGVGPNNPGNTLIIGHNYRDGRFFANNKNLSIGDKIYITDLNGKRLAYTIYDKFETTTEDTEFITRNTNGAREISLQTCTDDGSMRLIILAKCDLDS